MTEAELGYGSPDDMMAGGPGDAELANMDEPQAPEEGGAEAAIAEGVQAFMESQDPQIAVQVVMMLAEQMGIAPAGGGGAPDPMAGGGSDPMPMAKHGGKFGFFSDDKRAGEFMKFVNK